MGITALYMEEVKAKTLFTANTAQLKMNLSEQLRAVDNGTAKVTEEFMRAH